jgi:hypothetical protein
MKHDVNSDSYHLCTTEIGDVVYIYHTCPIIDGDVELKTTTKTHELPIRPVSGEVCHVSWSMKDSVRSGFEGGKETMISYVL